MNTFNENQIANRAMTKSGFNSIIKINMKTKKKSRTNKVAAIDWAWYYSY